MITPIRMCINCRNRFEQNKLIRLQCIENKLYNYSYTGRSFYICKECSIVPITLKKIDKLCGKNKNNNTTRDVFLKIIEEINS